LTEAELRMSDTIDHTRGEFAKIRTGRANPGLIANLPVDYYGTKTPLQQIAGVSVPEPRMLLVNPYDANALRDIERAIQAADLGINPSNDGTVIRVVFPELSQHPAQRQERARVLPARRRHHAGRAPPRRERPAEADGHLRGLDRRVPRAQGTRAARGVIRAVHGAV
jgi:ribosome recycling factor